VLFRPLILGLVLAYIPKGPVSPSLATAAPAWERFWLEVDALCRRKHCVFLKVEPDAWAQEEGEVSLSGLPAVTMLPGFQISSHNFQPPRTIIVDLGGSEEDILGRMKQKTRYNIHLAERKGVKVEPGSDIGTFYQLMAATAERDRFAVHAVEYYQRAYELFSPSGQCELLFAKYQGETIGGLMVFAHGRRAWYFYGASSDDHRNLMPNYLLQWEAMRWARRHGCRVYDLWGVPDADEQILENNFTRFSHGLWGVYRFKRGFGGKVVRAAGSWDRVYKPTLYSLYCRWMNRRAEGAALA
jgi:lipid II:glycine glycyltransferase (peptidoglycan interpeptide bridge formation enzyme)